MLIHIVIHPLVLMMKKHRKRWVSVNYELLKTWYKCSFWQQTCSTFAFSQISGMENDVSSTTTSGDNGFSVNTTVANDDVKITLFTEEAFLQEAIHSVFLSLLGQSIQPKKYKIG